MTLISKPLHELDEREFTTIAVGTKTNPGLARSYGFWAYHVLRSKESEPGFPDWYLLRERAILLELKREAGVLSPAQKDVGRRLLEAGQEFYVVRPSDLEALGKVLAYRGNPFAPLAWGTAAARPAAELRQATRIECAADPPPPGRR